MAGNIIYSYPIYKAIEAGYVKRLKAIQLNPKSLRYVRTDSGQEIEVTLEEVKQLGEDDAEFRRSIVTSKETLDTIVDASIRALQQLRSESGDQRLKIIASALNYAHCHQIVEAYAARGLKADYVHSRAESKENDRVLERLNNHDLDIIVQVRKLGEGFDHKHLAVAAVFSIFSNLSPFIQFVGRIMRVVTQNSPSDLCNRGIVVFHAGANIARRWSDFQEYSEADQEYFDQLLPLEVFDPDDATPEREYEPIVRRTPEMEVRAQSDIAVEEIPLLAADEIAAIRLLQERGRITGDVDITKPVFLEPIPTTKAYERQAKRASLDARIQTTAARILHERSINPGGYDLSIIKGQRTNLIVLKAAIDKHVNNSVNRKAGDRSNFSRLELNNIESNFDFLVQSAVEEVFGGKN